jgi:hypothetical protein
MSSWERGDYMRKLLFGFLALAVAAGAFVYERPQESQRLMGELPFVPKPALSKPLYQWKDARGEWQVTDRPPPGRTSFQVKRYGLDTNILPVSQLPPARGSTD